MIKSSTLFLTSVFVFFMITVFLYLYKTNKDFRVFIYNKKKDARLFIRRDLPRSPSLIIQNAPKARDYMVDSIDQVPSVYNQVKEFWTEEDPSFFIPQTMNQL